MEVPFLVEEIREAVFNMAGDKSSGPDGFFMCFYQACWDIIKEDLLKVFVEFHLSDIINVGTNATFLVLIPKKEGAVEITNFIPISLITSLYKIIAKVLSTRL